jgi:hypothetical protein
MLPCRYWFGASWRACERIRDLAFESAFSSSVSLTLLLAPLLGHELGEVVGIGIVLTARCGHFRQPSLKPSLA